MQYKTKLAIVTSDWHIMSEKPRHRLSGFVAQQLAKVKYILDLCVKYNADLYNAGDVCDRARIPRWLVSKYLYLFSSYMDVNHYACAGQHDQVFHSWDLRDTTIQQFFAANFFKRGGNGIQTADWGTDISNKKGIVIAHVCTTEKPIEFIDYAITAKKLMEQTKAKIIVTGDYHHAHYYEKDGRLIVNPGSIMRLSSDSVNKRPSVYLIDTERVEIVDQILLPVKSAEEVFDLDNINKQKEDKKKSDELKNRFDSYLVKIKQDTIKPDFEKTLLKVIVENKLSEDVKLEIDDIMEAV